MDQSKRLKVSKYSGNRVINKIFTLSVFLIVMLFINNNLLHAQVITYSSMHTNSITATGAYTAFNVDPVISNSLTPFDSSLGTLEDVQINISGDVTFSGTSGFNPLWIGNNHVPQPYSINSSLSLGLSSANGEYFSFLDPMVFDWQVVTSGLNMAELPTVTTSFNLSYDFENLLNAFIISDANCFGCSNVNGFSPPYGITGGLQEFVDNNILADQLSLIYQLNFTESGKLFGSESSITADSAINIETVYAYSAANVPEPTSIFLLSIGLFVLIFIQKNWSVSNWF